jgi:uncharacterized protein (TIGR03000 family)
MSLKSIHMIGVLSLALLGVCLTSQPAAAQQQGWPFMPQNRWWENGSSRTYQSSSPSYTPSVALVVAPAQASAQIQLEVPASAKVWFNGQPTIQTGSSRTFVSPPLATGFKYQYAVHIEWQDGVRKSERTQTISFNAGDRLNLDLATPQQTVAAPNLSKVGN